jgi:hypothetical protein
MIYVLRKALLPAALELRDVYNREWIRLRKVGFEPTNLSRSDTMTVLFVHIYC